MTNIILHRHAVGSIRQFTVQCADLPNGFACSIFHLEGTDRWTRSMRRNNFSDVTYAVHHSENEAIAAAKTWVRRKCKEHEKQAAQAA